ncbi:MAG: rhomboid family intramembrane serine protease [Cyclobacteriaceae bacterium]|nr:rhomboid family intramembrane serine protease [Cyclobacteriaceae bacterium]
MNFFAISNVLSRSIIPFRFVFIMWLLFSAEYVYGYKIHHLGILPRNLYGLIGIVIAPVLHLNLVHIVSNTLPLLMLGAGLFYFYYSKAKLVFYGSFFLPNILVWFFARPIIHIGASGIIYSIATYLVMTGLIKRDLKSLLISIAVVIVYSSLFFGLVKQLETVSYELHFAGVAVGLGLAVFQNFNFFNPSTNG